MNEPKKERSWGIILISVLLTVIAIPLLFTAVCFPITLGIGLHQGSAQLPTIIACAVLAAAAALVLRLNHPVIKWVIFISLVAIVVIAAAMMAMSALVAH